MRAISLTIAGLVCMAAGSAASADVVAFDQMTAVANTNWNIPSTVGVPTGSGNRQMGGVVNLAGTDTQISGFDLALVNATGAAITNSATTVARLNWWIWNTHTGGTSTSTLAMSSLAGSGTSDFNLGALTTPFANNTLLFIGTGGPGAAGFPPVAGTTGGVSFAPVTVTQTTGIGFAFRWDLSTDGGLTFTQPNGLTSLITGGAAVVAPTVGSNANSGTYYRSPQVSTTDNNGNFAQGSARQIGANSGVVSRFYTVPAPASAALLGLGGFVAARRRRN